MGHGNGIDDSSYCQRRWQKNFQGMKQYKDQPKNCTSLPPSVHFISGK